MVNQKDKTDQIQQGRHHAEHQQNIPDLKSRIHYHSENHHRAACLTLFQYDGTKQKQENLNDTYNQAAPPDLLLIFRSLLHNTFTSSLPPASYELFILLIYSPSVSPLTKNRFLFTMFFHL